MACWTCCTCEAQELCLSNTCSACSVLYQRQLLWMHASVRGLIMMEQLGSSPHQSPDLLTVS